MKFSIWSGSHVIKKKDLQAGLKGLQKLGFDYEISKAVASYSISSKTPLLPFLAGSDALKIEELLKILTLPTAHWVLATRGGYGCLRLLRELDKAAITRSEPLYLWGYSDITILQLYLWQRKGWPYVQGPLIGGETFVKPMPKEEKILGNIARFKVFPSSFAIRPLDPKITAPKGSLLLLGGNLASIVSMLGTTWEPRPSTPFLLFLEDIEEPGYKIDRLLCQLSNSRLFENCQGIVLGHFTRSPDYRNVFKAFARLNKIAVYSGLPMGHEAPRIPIVMGTSVTIEKNRLIFGAHPFGPG